MRTLGRADLPAFLALSAQDPTVNVFAEYRARSTAMEPRWLGGQIWGRFVDDELVAACHAAANLVPVGCDEESARAFARHARDQRRRPTTIVGLSDAVAWFADEIDGAWGTPRDARWRQPHLEYVGPPAVAPDPLVRHSTMSDLETLYPECVAMYTEEVGISPESSGGAELYRARIKQLIGRRWSFVRFDDDGRLLFKAEVACATPYAAQVQGVWVPPELRGRGLASAGMAAVAEAVRTEIAPVVALYVNEWNTGARRVYERVGFVETACFSTLMF